jgi:hypothetical protein
MSYIPAADSGKVFDPVSKPRHYLSHPSGIEMTDVARHMTYTAGNAYKYVFRTELKNGLQDLEKACWYLVDTIDNSKSQVWVGPCEEGVRLLVKVIEFEPDRLKREFYSALFQETLGTALAVVHQMIKEISTRGWA